jgi:hypothetical protein
VAADEPFGDARLVEADGLLGVAALLGPLGLSVALHRGLEAAQRVVLRPDSVPLGPIETEEASGTLGGGGLLPGEDVSQPPQNHREAFPPEPSTQV